MTPKQEAFVREYLVDLNQTEAARRVGYTGRWVNKTANKLMQEPEIRDAIDAAMKARGERTRITADRVLQEIERMAMLDVVELVKVRRVADIAKLPEDVRRAIVGWTFDRNGRLQLKLAKEGALQMLGRHHRLFNDKLEVEVVDRAAALAKARERAKKGRA